MRYSKLFAKTSKTAPHDADSVNARLLVQGGFVDQVMAGVYAWLPLGLRALRNVERVVREEMDALGAQEVHLTALQPKENWETTGRWDTVDVLFKIPSQTKKEYALGPTAEEVITPLAKSFLRSYKDFPAAVYQIQTKFRDELRAKSGVLRGREFLMKDMYSFHVDEADFAQFYEKATQAYLKTYSRCGVEAKIVEASGGSFSTKPSHEFQVETPAGEDNLILCRACTFAQNAEVATVKEGDACPKCGGALAASKGIEVGNIFELGTKYSTPFELTAVAADGGKVPVLMGCYGIGVSRLVGTIVEACNDERGIVWPKGVAPYPVHMVSLAAKEPEAAERVRAAAEKLEAALTAAGLEPLFDERADARAGEKFADADLIGLPVRLVLSEKTLAEDSAEWKDRKTGETRMVKLAEVVAEVQRFMAA